MNADLHITEDPNLIDINFVYKFLSKDSGWQKDIGIDNFYRAIKNSMCFSLFDHNGSQIGFARCITDKATFAYIDDFFIMESVRGKGYGSYIFSHIINHNDLKSVCSWWLLSNNISVIKISEKFGFNNPSCDRIEMWKARPKIKNELYKK